MPHYPTTQTPGVNGNVGSVRSGNWLSGYVFASGLNKPEHSKLLSYLYPQYYMTAMLDRFESRSVATTQETFSWNEQDRTRRKGAVQTINSGIGGPVLTITVTAATENYFIPADIVFIPSSVDPVTGQPRAVLSARVETATATQLTLRKLDGSNWSGLEITATPGQPHNEFGHGHNLHGEYSDAPQSRLYLPNEKSNNLGILRKSCTVSGSALSNRTYVPGSENWYFENEGIMLHEFANDRELYVMFGERVDNTNGFQSGDGIVTSVIKNGTNTDFTGALTEADIQFHMERLSYQAPKKEWLCLSGKAFQYQFHNAMKHYALNAADFGSSFKDIDMAGLNFKSYMIGSDIVHVAEYEMFNDPNIFTHVSNTNMSNFRNWRQSGLWLNMGYDNSGTELIRMRHKEFNGLSRKLVYGHILGMIGTGAQGREMTADEIISSRATTAQLSNAKDGMEIHVLSEIGIEFRCPHWSGLMRRTA